MLPACNFPYNMKKNILTTGTAWEGKCYPQKLSATRDAEEGGRRAVCLGSLGGGYCCTAQKLNYMKSEISPNRRLIDSTPLTPSAQTHKDAAVPLKTLFLFPAASISNFSQLTSVSKVTKFCLWTFCHYLFLLQHIHSTNVELFISDADAFRWESYHEKERQAVVSWYAPFA